MSFDSKDFSIIPSIIENDINKLKNDNKSGALKLTKLTAEIFIKIVENYEISYDQKLFFLIEKIAKIMIDSQPNMAPIFNLSNDLINDINKYNTEEEIINFVRDYCNNFLKNLSKSNRLISGFTYDLIKDKHTIIVHSYSDTVLEALINAKYKGKSFKVICTESRPINEGLLFAKELDKYNIDTSLVVDYGIFSFIKNVDLILVGADSILKDGIINKIGTLGLAISAKRYNKKIYSLCNTNKILPINYNYEDEKLKKSSEITKMKFNNVKIYNYYFDITPLDYFNGIISEIGIINDENILKIMIKKRINKNFI